MNLFQKSKHLYRVAVSIVRERKKARRSPAWRHARDLFLATHEACPGCGKKKRLQVHHVRPYHLFPELELDPKNFLVLCMGEAECHFLLGHGSDFKAYNPHVLDDLKFLATGSARDVVEEKAKTLRRYVGD